jgi:hypothetical protein
MHNDTHEIPALSGLSLHLGSLLPTFTFTFFLIVPKMYFTESPLLTCSRSPCADLTYPSIPVYIRWPFYPQGFSLFPPSHKCRRHFNPPELRYPSIVSYAIITPSHLPIGNVGRLRELSCVIIPKLQIPNYLHSTHILTQISQNRVGERESESERVE